MLIPVMLIVGTLIFARLGRPIWAITCWLALVIIALANMTMVFSTINLVWIPLAILLVIGWLIYDTSTKKVGAK